MSDSDFESVFGEYSSSVVAPRKDKKRKAPSSTTARSVDSDCETTALSSSAIPKKKSVSKPRASRSAKDLFGLLSEDEENLAIENSQHRSASGQKLDSSLTSKVANGVVRRVNQLNGAFYVEVRVYNTREAVKTPPEERYKKALVTLKLQLNPDTSEWRDLQKFMKSTKLLFDDKEPVYYSNKINFK